MWDPLRGSAEGEGKVLMQASADVAHFTLGNRFKGEHDLVVYVVIFSSYTIKLTTLQG